jgi:CelD/BcsL family acetyltransferase involved in cellulose biosynthesis
MVECKGRTSQRGQILTPTHTTTSLSEAWPGLAIAELRWWTEEKFRTSEAEWQDLLARSDADPLFMSWAWQWLWWCHHSRLLKSRLYLIAAYTRDGQLVGLAPFHLHRAAHRKPLSAMRLEIIGSTWRDATGAFSEYLDFVVDRRFEDVFLETLANFVMRRHDWSDLVLANSKRHSVAARFVHQHLKPICYIREADPLVAQLAVLPQSFDNYVQTLNSGVRRKVYRQRTKLVGTQFSAVTRERVGEVFNLFNHFHERRWGRTLFRDSLLDFHTEFALLCADRGALRMSILSVEGSPISAIYDVRIGKVEYNIQCGFDTSLAGISPGYLHFGFSMEAACRDGVSVYDFLAGDGRSRNYKSDFNTRLTELVTFQCLRGPLAWLYRFYDRRTPESAAA